MVLVVTVVVAQVVQHKPKISCLRNRLRQWLVMGDELEISGKFPSAQIWLIEALSLGRTAYKHLLKLDDVVFGAVDAYCFAYNNRA